MSETLYRGDGSGKWLGGVPDAFALVIGPLAAFTVYGADELAFALRGRSFSGDENPGLALSGRF